MQLAKSHVALRMKGTSTHAAPCLRRRPAGEMHWHACSLCLQGVANVFMFKPISNRLVQSHIIFLANLLHYLCLSLPLWARTHRSRQDLGCLPAHISSSSLSAQTACAASTHACAMQCTSQHVARAMDEQWNVSYCANTICCFHTCMCNAG